MNSAMNMGLTNMGLTNMPWLNAILLTVVTFLPAIGGLLILLIPRRDRDIKIFALVIAYMVWMGVR